MLTEPVKCNSCGSISVNGGVLHCDKCFKKLQFDLESETAAHRNLQSEYEKLLAENGRLKIANLTKDPKLSYLPSQTAAKAVKRIMFQLHGAGRQILQGKP